MKIAWFSCGVTSAVATKIALELYEDVQIYYIHIESAHEDNARFIKDCERWYGQKINIITNSIGFKDQFSVMEKRRFINGPFGAPCTSELKRIVREELEEKLKPDNQIFGFEYSRKEINRAIKFLKDHSQTNPLFPLIDKKKNKAECHGLLDIAGIKTPAMYRLGFENNNCIGCVKGGKGYWNKIREEFPETFNKMAALERDIGATCLKEQEDDENSKRLYLDELKPKEGILNPVVPDCGMFCQVELAETMEPTVEKVLSGEMTVHEAAIVKPESYLKALEKLTKKQTAKKSKPKKNKDNQTLNLFDK